MKLLIVTNNSNISSIYRKLIENIVQFSLIFECKSAEDAIFTVLNEQVNLVITEAKLNGHSGFELAHSIYCSKISCLVIIIADNEQCAIEAIKAHAFELIIKPFRPEKFTETLNRALTKISAMKINHEIHKKNTVKIRVNSTSGFNIFDINKLMYCIADGAYTKIFLTDQTEITSCYNIGKIEEILSHHNFSRINRSVIINTKFLNRIERYEYKCWLSGGETETEFDVSRKYMHLLEGRIIKEP